MPFFKYTLLACILGTFSLNAHAQTFSTAQGKVDADLKASLVELAQVRDSIAEEKIPLMTAVSSVEDEVIRLKNDLDRLRRLRDNSDLGLNRLRDQVESMKEQNEYAAGLLDEFVRSFETRIDYSETQLYSQATEDARLALDDTNMSQAERFEKQLDVISVALDRMDQLVGGYTFDGRGLEPSGDIEEGTYAVFGPTVYFASKQSDLAGLTFNKLNAAVAAIAVPGPQYSAGIRQLIETGEGAIPADATLGKAMKMVEGNDSIAEHLAKGGSVGVVIIALGLICLLLGLLKVLEISKFKTPKPEMLQAVLEHLKTGDTGSAKSAAAPDSTGLIPAGVAHANERRGTLEEILYEKILAVRPRLERFLPFIALTAAAAPLLGLLGTVTGMIKTFNLITIFGTGDAKSLSSGISEALVTTELGLVVAIPALIIHGLLSRMSRQKLAEMEQTAVGFINGVSTSDTSE
ncbi:MAG: MotA/TolQ/ExbB proton channel family protein [Puniceicoccaceae bacterium]|nr:MotA/TolQ/ExbB proton channel family protein [Puniceicoccaceae bacterium]